MNKGALLQNNTSNGGSVLGGAVTLAGNATAQGRVPATFIMNDGTIQYCTADYGGAVGMMNHCNFEMHGGVIQSNEAISNGGGVYMINDSTFCMDGGKISNNRAAKSGGGVMVIKTDTYGSGGTFTMGGTSEISDNQAATGGGVANTSSFTMSGDAKILRNTAETGGGGLVNADEGVFTMEDGFISGNTTKGSGGGIYNTYARGVVKSGKVVFEGIGKITFNSGSITRNTAKVGGGGIANNSGCTFVMKGGSITENSADLGGGGVFSYGYFTREAGVLYNNTADAMGADFYGSDYTKEQFESGSVSLGTVGSWALTSSGEKHVANGWYKDDAGDRWECDDNLTDARDSWSSKIAFGVKAAHGATPALVGSVESKLIVNGVRKPAVDSLENEAEERAREKRDKDVVLTMTVEARDEDKATGSEQIRDLAGENTQLEYQDITVLETVTYNVYAEGSVDSFSTETPIHITQKIQTIAVPFNFNGRANVRVFRYHVDKPEAGVEIEGTKTAKAEKLAEVEAGAQIREGTYQLDSTNGEVVIYAKKFSTYAIAYSEEAPAPKPPSGGGETKPAPGPAPQPPSGGGWSPAPPPGPAPAPAPSDRGDQDPELAPGPTPVSTPGARPVRADPTVTGVASLLNTDDHISFMDGYDTGLFGPFENITRAEVAQVFYNLLRDQNVSGAPYDDVPAGAWYARAVSAMRGLGVMVGTDGNRFEPDRPVTRGEFAVTAMRFAKLPEGGENIFTDVSKSDWYYPQIIGAVQYGWISGYRDGTYRPENPLTRAKAARIVNNMLGRSGDAAYIDFHLDKLRQFPDVDDNKYWAYYDIMEAVNPHKFKEDEDGEEWID